MYAAFALVVLYHEIQNLSRGGSIGHYRIATGRPRTQSKRGKTEKYIEFQFSPYYRVNILVGTYLLPPTASTIPSGLKAVRDC